MLLASNMRLVLCSRFKSRRSLCSSC